MDVFSFISLLGGLALFLYGMSVLSSGLSKIAGGKFEQILKNVTSSPVKALIFGAGVTAVIQSSSALSVMLIGIVNSGIMQLSQTVGVIMGANIGTTFTAWILSLAGIESSNMFIRLLKPSSFSPVVAFIGVIMIMSAKKQRRKDIGTILVGFAVLMYGMELMSGAVKPLADSPEFTGLLTAFTNPFLGIIVGAVFTGIIQSSSASLGVLQALSMTGSITYGVAIPIIMGQNIGTCVTALISSIGVNKNAKRVAVIHISFNIIGTIIFLIVYLILDAIYKFAFFDSFTNPVGIAISHSIFNIITTVILLPFQNQLVKLAKFFVRDIETVENYAFLDDRLLETPSFAVVECSRLVLSMAVIAKETILAANSLINNFNEKQVNYVIENEQTLDMYEDKLGTYLVKIATKNLTDIDSNEVSKLLHSIGDFERIGDHAVNLSEVAKEIDDKQLNFSDEAMKDLKILGTALEEILEITVEAFGKNSLDIASKVEPLEQVIDSLIKQVKLRHIERLQGGQCTIQLGFILSDLLTNIERVSDHCSNIAVGIIELKHNSFNTHEYLNHIKDGSDRNFIENYNAFSKKYVLA